MTEERIGRIARGLLDRSLPRADWTHAAHFAATLWLLRHRPDLDLPVAMPDIIRTYNVSVGGVNSDTAGYHETITQVSLRAAHAFLSARPAGEPLSSVLDRLMTSRLGDRDWPLDHWTRDRLFSVEARRAWIEPDIQPLPF